MDPARWTAAQVTLLHLAATLPGVDRIFVHPAIKRRLCADATGDRAWLRLIRPWWGHASHMHIRLRCPAGQTHCVEGPPPPPGDGCDASLDWWFAQIDHPPPPAPPRGPAATAGRLPRGAGRMTRRRACRSRWRRPGWPPSSTSTRRRRSCRRWPQAFGVAPAADGAGDHRLAAGGRAGGAVRRHDLRRAGAQAADRRRGGPGDRCRPCWSRRRRVLPRCCLAVRAGAAAAVRLHGDGRLYRRRVRGRRGDPGGRHVSAGVGRRRLRGPLHRRHRGRSRRLARRLRRRRGRDRARRRGDRDRPCRASGTSARCAAACARRCTAGASMRGNPALWGCCAVGAGMLFSVVATFTFVNLRLAAAPLRCCRRQRSGRCSRCIWSAW